MTKSIADPAPSPLVLVLRLFLLGLITVALVWAISGTTDQFDSKRKCHGGFSAEFIKDFQHPGCDLTIKHVGTGAEIKVRLPN